MNVCTPFVMSSSRTVQDFQNISLFSIGCLTLYACFSHDMTIVDILLPIVGLHALADLCVVTDPTLQIHHALLLSILGYGYYCGVSSEVGVPLSYSLLKTEISSVFYCLKYWLPSNGLLSHMNLVLFYLSFFKFRVLDYYIEIVAPSAFLPIVQIYSPSNYLLTALIVVPCYGMYVLNLYWFLILTKILYKRLAMIVRSLNTEILCHFVCSYALWINIPVCIYMYSVNPSDHYMYDIVGVTSLAVSSYFYHVDVYTRLVTKEIASYDMPTQDNVVPFFNDVVGINIRSYFSVLTCYYYSDYFWSVAILAGIQHGCSLYKVMVAIFHLMANYDEEKADFLKRLNLVSGLPIAIDICLICANSPSEFAIPLLFVSITIGLLFILEPFYKQTHSVFHFLLIAQNYFLCSAHRTQKQ